MTGARTAKPSASLLSHLVHSAVQSDLNNFVRVSKLGQRWRKKIHRVYTSQPSINIQARDPQLRDQKLPAH